MTEAEKIIEQCVRTAEAGWKEARRDNKGDGVDMAIGLMANTLLQAYLDNKISFLPEKNQITFA